MVRLYNEAMGKNLADKYSHLSNQLDKIVNDANSEIQSLQSKIKGAKNLGLEWISRADWTVGLQIDQKTLQQKNVELVEMYRDKSKKQAQTQHLYDTLKKRVMTSQVQTAASDSVAQAINSMSSIPRPQTFEHSSFPQAPPANFRPDDQRGNIPYQQVPHSRSPSQSSRNAHIEIEAGGMPPPPGPLHGQHSRMYFIVIAIMSADHSRYISDEYTTASDTPARHRS